MGAVLFFPKKPANSGKFQAVFPQDIPKTAGICG
jgi:hypothetical protein